MPNVLLIESRDHFGRQGHAFTYQLAHALARDGRQVTVLLVQNGVLHARPGAPASGIVELIATGATVLADEFSLRERGIAADRLASGVRVSPLDVVVDRLIDGWQVIWH